MQLFDSIDTDGGGTLDKAELGNALAKMNKPRSEVWTAACLEATCLVASRRSAKHYKSPR